MIDHCFSLTSENEEGRVSGLDGVMNAYNENIENIILSGPS